MGSYSFTIFQSGMLYLTTRRKYIAMEKLHNIDPQTAQTVTKPCTVQVHSFPIANHHEPFGIINDVNALFRDCSTSKMQIRKKSLRNVVDSFTVDLRIITMTVHDAVDERSPGAIGAMVRAVICFCKFMLK